MKTVFLFALTFMTFIASTQLCEAQAIQIGQSRDGKLAVIIGDKYATLTKTESGIDTKHDQIIIQEFITYETQEDGSLWVAKGSKKYVVTLNKDNGKLIIQPEKDYKSNQNDMLKSEDKDMAVSSEATGTNSDQDVSMVAEKTTANNTMSQATNTTTEISDDTSAIDSATLAKILKEKGLSPAWDLKDVTPEIVQLSSGKLGVKYGDRIAMFSMRGKELKGGFRAKTGEELFKFDGNTIISSGEEYSMRNYGKRLVVFKGREKSNKKKVKRVMNN